MKKLRILMGVKVGEVELHSFKIGDEVSIYDTYGEVQLRGWCICC